MKYIAAIIILLFQHFCFAQPKDNIPIKYKTRNVIGLTPVYRNVRINGLAIGFMGKPWREAESLKINGMNIDGSPFALFGGVLALVGTFLAPFTNMERSDGPRDEIGFSDVFPDSITVAPETEIHGLSFGAGLLRNTELHGVAINVFVSFSDQTSGVDLTGIMNLHYTFNGVLIAGLRNKTTTGKGVQIGLINTCKSGRLIQIGLLNRIGRRILPIINISLRNRRVGDG